MSTKNNIGKRAGTRKENIQKQQKADHYKIKSCFHDPQFKRTTRENQ